MAFAPFLGRFFIGSRIGKKLGVCQRYSERNVIAANVAPTKVFKTNFARSGVLILRKSHVNIT